jgi:predicted Zn-dependent protease
MLDEQDTRRLTATILGYVKADDATVDVRSRIHSYLRFAANAPQTSGRAETASAQIVVWIGQRRGSVTTSDLTDASLRAAVEQAETLARISPVDREYLPTLGLQQYMPVDAYADATANLSVSDRARSVGEAIGAAEKAGVVSAGFHQAEASTSGTATRNGNFSYQRHTVASLGMTARTREGGGSGFFLRSHVDATRLEVPRIAREAIRRAAASRNARPLAPGVYPVILEAQAVADMMSGGGLGFDARAAEEGRSPFSAPGGRTRVGERVFDDRINIVSDPWRAELPGWSVAAGGIPAGVVFFARNGLLETLISSRYWAQEKKREPTPGPVNWILEASGRTASLEEMIRATERGLLVARFWYIRMVDPRRALLTGLTRDGLWWIEQGRIAYPVRNFRFNQSVVEMLAPGNVEMIGASERVSASESQGTAAMLAPPLRLRAFAFTSASDAV